MRVACIAVSQAFIQVIQRVLIQQIIQLRCAVSGRHMALTWHRPWWQLQAQLQALRDSLRFTAELRYERLQNKLSSRERPALTLRWPSTYHWSASLTSDVPRVPVCLLPVAHNEDWVVRWDYC